jgi:hypothetical protein
MTGLAEVVRRFRLRRERRAGVERDATLGQMAVEVTSWPPRGDLVVRAETPPDDTLRAHAWPAGAPLRLDPDAALDTDEAGAGHFWLAGRREGSQASGPRDPAPRLAPVGARGYVFRRQPIDALTFAPALPRKNRFTPWAQRCAWLTALLFPMAWGSDLFLFFFILALFASLGLAALAWVKRPAA